MADARRHLRALNDMPRRYLPPPEDPRDREIRELRSDLWVARHDILELFRDREELHDVLTAYYRCDDHKQRGKWKAWAVETLLKTAEVKHGREFAGYSEPSRAYCPLCGSGSQAPYAEGFTFPTGLERHFLGTHRAHQCRVFRAADRLCLDRVLDNEKNPQRITPLLAEDRPPPPWERPPPPAPPKPNAHILEFRPKGEP